MTDNLKLYYNARTKKFSLFQTSENKVVFETHYREGKDKGKDDIKQDTFRIEVRTNFWPQAPQREYIYVNIYINNILLLPISKAWRKVSYYKINVIYDVFIEEWGNNIGVVNCYPTTPSTIVLLRKRAKGKEFNWFEVLSSICHICNNYEKWIEQEVEEFVIEMQKREKVYWRRLVSAISVIRTYDTLVPEIKNIYRPIFDYRVIDGIRTICDNLEKVQMDKSMSKTYLIKTEANILWAYLNDYLI